MNTRVAKVVEVSDIITVAEISSLLNVQPSAVSNWRKRYKDYPSSLGTSNVFSKREVIDWWLKRHAKILETGAYLAKNLERGTVGGQTPPPQFEQKEK